MLIQVEYNSNFTERSASAAGEDGHKYNCVEHPTGYAKHFTCVYIHKGALDNDQQMRYANVEPYCQQQDSYMNSAKRIDRKRRIMLASTHRAFCIERHKERHRACEPDLYATWLVSGSR